MPVVFACLLFFPLFLFANTEFEQIFDDHTAVMLLIEPKSGKIVKANQAAADFYGYSSQTLQSKTIQEINLFTAEQVAEERKNAHRQKRNYFIFRHQTATGDIKTVEVYSIPIEFHGATLLYSVIKDISTQRQYQSEIWQYQKNLEQMVDSQVAIIKTKNNKIHAIYIAGLVVLITLALFLTYLLRITRKAQKYSIKLSQIVEQSPSAIITTDLQGYIDYQNKHSESALFAKLSSSKRSLFDELRDLTQLRDEFDNAISTNTPWVDRINLGQEQQWLHAHLYPLINNQQKKDGYVLILNDISKQKQDEKQLRLSSTVFRTANEAVMICDKNYRIQAVNEAFTEITGYHSDEVLNKTPDILSSDLQTEPFYANMQHQLDENNQWQGEICNRRKNGELYYEWLSITALRDNNGEIDAFVALFSDITKRKTAENKIYQQANFDSLTGLANRNLFSDRFEQALNKAQREHSFLALLFIDLDGFKHVNDTLGHSQGDTLLQQTATRLSSTLRKSDTISRLGGDEFAVLIASDNNQFKVDRVAHKIQAAIAAPYQLDNAQGFVSASIGITTYPNDGKDVETLMRKADSAMYKAKAKGKNNFQFFTAEMDEKAQKRRTLEGELRTAIDNQQFFIDYQPIFDAKHNIIYACEALVRWHHPTKGLVSPDQFIELAEEIGVIANIGEFVLEQACVTAAKWQDEYKNAPGISVNISTIQFQRDDFIATIKSTLEVSGLPSNKLILEITESLLIENDKKTIAQLTMLANLGVKIAIDDFGTGYSSLSYLKKFPVHKLKIDRSFIKDVEHNAESQALTKAIIAMSKSLKLEVIAEGVELNAQMHWLTASDCSLIQGYWFAKPVDALTIKELLAEHNG